MQVPLHPSFMTSCIYIALDELILIIVIAFQLGYFFAKKKFQKNRKSSQNKNFNSELHPLSLDIFPAPQSIQGRQIIEINSKMQKQDEKKSIHIEKDQDSLPKQFLLQKVAMEGKKIQSRGIFHMTLEQSQNSRFLRKIQKHQIITDYQIQQNQKKFQMIPVHQQHLFSLSDQKSILEINAYENFRFKDVSPYLQKKLLKMNQFDSFKNQFHIHLAPSLCENGKFNKFFINKKKIGQGAFGTVFSATNILQGKQYAVKKLFIKRQGNQQKMQKILNQTIRQVNIISKYSHPNIVRFHTCWIQIANLNQAIDFNKLQFEQIERISQNDFPFMKKKSSHNQQYVQVSYVSSNNNSDIQFVNSPSVTKQSIQNETQFQKQETRIIPSNKNIQSNSQNTQDFHPVYTLYIQMELCNEGTLWNYLNLRKKIDRIFSFVVFQQLSLGVQYLHANGLVHRDLKPANILLSKREKKIKIGDFGLSINLSEELIKNRGVGTPSYIAPQILQNKQIKKQEYHLTDVYSIGVIYFEMLNMFNNATRHQRIQKINNLRSNIVELQRQYNLQMKLIKSMTKSKGRPSIDVILKKKQFMQLKQLFCLQKNSNDWSCIDNLIHL